MSPEQNLPHAGDGAGVVVQQHGCAEVGGQERRAGGVGHDGDPCCAY